MDDVNAADIARFFDAESASARLCHRNVRIAYEQRVKALMFDTGTWGTVNPTQNYTIANAAPGAATPFDFIKDMKAMKRKVGKRGEMPNTLTMSEPLWDLIQRVDSSSGNTSSVRTAATPR